MDINIRTVFRLKKYSPKEFTKVIPLHTAHQESSRGGESENQPVLSEWQIAGKLMKMAWRNPDVWKQIPPIARSMLSPLIYSKDEQKVFARNAMIYSTTTDQIVQIMRTGTHQVRSLLRNNQPELQTSATIQLTEATS